MRLLFAGESWSGSNARSLAEALTEIPGVVLRAFGSESPPREYTLVDRIAKRLLRRLHDRRQEVALWRVLRDFRPDALVAYKGTAIGPGFLTEMLGANIPAVNVFPDYSPHAYGARLQEAIGRYDLVISTKHYHAPQWRSLYGYENKCVYVPHGYDPKLHLWGEAAPADRYDVALCATWRPEYDRLALALARELSGDPVSVSIAGGGWVKRRGELPSSWQLVGPLSGRSYGQFLRSAKIVIAPLNTEVVIRGRPQPGDEDTARTYELAAAHCFFLHQRSPLVQTIYDDRLEVPMWKDAVELSALIRRWLPDHSGRQAMARRAHARAVPAYSTRERAVAVFSHIEALVKSRRV